MFPTGLIEQNSLVKHNVILGLGVISAAFIAYNIYKRFHQRDDSNWNWKPVGTVSALNIHPIKSCHRIEVKEANCGKLGLYNEEFCDRSFMVVNSHNIFLHARKYPEMVLIKISMEQNQVKLTSPILDPITFTIPSSSETAETRIVKVWGQKVSALDCGDEVAKWLSQQILNQDSGARLVYYPYSHSPRSVSTKPTLPFLKETDGSIFSDLTPYHLLSMESVEELNSRLDPRDTVLPLNFRPNIIVTGCTPYAEDDWRYIRIGKEATFRFLKHCTRCVMTTVDPLTGIKNPECEPERTLKTYRMDENEGSPIFGIDMGLEVEGKICVGDVVYLRH